MPNSGDDDGVADAVFLVVQRTPPHFILGPATGVGHLGFEDDFITGDSGQNGQPIRIAPAQGTLQQGRTFSETVGTLCHEYGHVLGLPDLFNTAFLRSDEPGAPENDSAGIGRWGLMGWGALGWQGDDGPASFSAWSRLRLGWAQIDEPQSQEEEMRLEDVGRNGRLYKIPLSGREYFLAEYRRRSSTYYDRGIPAEGLLVWHVERTLPAPGAVPQWVVDLECADGRFTEAGYPLGQSAAPKTGGDNLDFWAHDSAYAQEHGGNLGDTTDPFGSPQYPAFTPATNPAATSNDGRLEMHLQQIRLQDGLATAQVKTAPALLVVEDLILDDSSGNGIIAAGEEVQIRFTLTNQGGVRMTDLWAVLTTADSLATIVQPEARFRDLNIGRTTLGATAGTGFPRFRLESDFIGVHTAELVLAIFAGDLPLALEEFTASAISPRQTVASIDLLDPLGNGDGQVQPGEFFHLQLALDLQRAHLLNGLTFNLHSLDEQVQQLDDSRILWSADTAEGIHSLQTPEFLAAGNLPAGHMAAFELLADSGFGTWRDTLHIAIAPGADRTPPRLGQLQARQEDGLLKVFLPAALAVDGSALEQVSATFYAVADSSILATVPLVWDGRRYVGIWDNGPPGTYLLSSQAVDAAGNGGQSRLQRINLLSRADLPGGDQSTAPWRLLGPHSAHWQPRINNFANAPADPNTLYLTTSQSLLRSTDGGRTWSRTPLMRPPTNIWVDALDPRSIYLGNAWIDRVFHSRDGGFTWNQYLMTDRSLLGIDRVVPGRLYSWEGFRRLGLSHDGGVTWEDTGLDWPNFWRPFFLTCKTDPLVTYAGLSQQDSQLALSQDGGASWTVQPLDFDLQAIALDPNSCQGLYAASSQALYYSADGGAYWQQRSQIDEPLVDLVVHPQDPLLLTARISRGPKEILWRSTDGGFTWTALEQPDGGFSFVFVLDPGRARIFLQSFEKAQVSHDGGLSWNPMELQGLTPPVGGLDFSPSGQLYIGSENNRPDNTRSLQSGIYRSDDGGLTWQWLSQQVRFWASGGLAILVDPDRPTTLLGLTPWNLMRSLDEGQNWDEVVGTSSTFNISGVDPARGLVADTQSSGVYYFFSRQLDEKALYRSTDFGQTWLPRAGGLDGRLTGGITLDPRTPSILYAGLSDQVWRSQDAGLNWSLRAAFAPTEHIAALGFSPRGEDLYAATTHTLYRSQDKGLSWTQLRPLDPTDPRRLLRFSPHKADLVLLVEGRRLLVSQDQGRTWDSLDPGLGLMPWFNEVAVDPFDPELIYAATPHGLYSRRLQTATTVDPAAATGNAFALEPNYPNPFNAATAIAYTLPTAARVDVNIYNALGQQIRQLVHARQPAGYHTVIWDGRNEDGQAVSSGVYFYRLTAEGTGQHLVQTRKLALIR